jgi:hypothetical protein
MAGDNPEAVVQSCLLIQIITPWLKIRRLITSISVGLIR